MKPEINSRKKYHFDATQSDSDAIRSDWKAALLKFEEYLSKKSPLEMSATEMSLAGTPPQALLDNPNMTWGETMDDYELFSYLKDVSDTIQRMLAKDNLDDFEKIQLRIFKTTLTLSITYLNRIDRLPAKFKSRSN